VKRWHEPGAVISRPTITARSWSTPPAAAGVVEAAFHSTQLTGQRGHGDRTFVHRRAGTNLVDYTVLVLAPVFVSLRSSDEPGAPGRAIVPEAHPARRK
jgi:hypothetical protein